MRSVKSSKYLDRAKVIAGLGVFVSGLYGAQALTLFLSGTEELQLEGIMFLLPKFLLIFGALLLYFNPRAALWIYGTAAFISVIATILGFTLFSLDMISFGLHHIPAFIFYAYMIWLLILYLNMSDEENQIESSL